MATAEEILQPNPEGYIVVGGDRFITVPKNLKRLGVQHDHNIETVTFKCPKCWDGQDMSQMAIYINYARSDKYFDRYPADNIRVDGDIMHFDWTISRNVTEVAGPIVFLVCVMKTTVGEDGEPVEERHWNSELCQDCYISEGMETEEHPAEEYPDEITNLLERMLVVEGAKAEMQKMLDDTAKCATQAEDVLLAVNGSSDYVTKVQEDITNKAAEIRNSYANAIKGNVSGEVIRVDDVSPIEHDVKCWVHGKNLFNASIIPVGAGVTNNYITAVGEGFIEITCQDPYDGNGHLSTGVKLKELCPQMRPGKTYMLSATTDAFNKCMYLAQLDYFWQFNTAITVTEEMLECGTGFYGYAPYRGQEHGTCRVYDIQIEEGSIVTAYEPCVDPSTATLKRFGKNLLNPNRGSSSQKGLTLTNNGDGSFTLTGTATAAASFGLTNLTTDPLYLRNGVAYTQSVIILSGSMSGVAVVPSVVDDDGNITWNYFSNNQTKTPDKQYKFWSYEVYVENGRTVNLRFKVQLEVGKTATEYEPYKTVTTHIPSADGTCTLTSVNPTMTLFTDTPGVIIEAEYNRDTTKMFESYVLTDEAKTEIAGKVEADMAEVLASLNEYATSLIGGGT